MLQMQAQEEAPTSIDGTIKGLKPVRTSSHFKVAMSTTHWINIHLI
jgi:hypothetical protein